MYQLPIEVEPRIMQGYDGPYSHKEFERNTSGRDDGLIIVDDDTYSLDFQVPLGTQVYASRGGIVELACKHSEEVNETLERDLCMPNFVLIDHGDGTHAIYSHFAPFDGVVVNRGDQVKQGDLLGFTGKSGWLGPIPHLHFEALKFVDPLKSRKSFPISFGDYNGPLHHKELNLK